jgi:hypothetical protein
MHNLTQMQYILILGEWYISKLWIKWVRVNSGQARTTKAKH